ncbi:MAG: OmcA/MtrC family decaheme c-type cytochrome [Sideroxydans sp.]|nr:OmcA/MtrC family decaheme c-type cytochrome [Sideroxydans sp.]
MKTKQRELAATMLMLVILQGCGGGGSSPSSATVSGANSVVAAVRTSAPVASCPNGGISVDTGIDKNGNGILDASEVINTQYVCNGVSGTAGTGGLNALVSVTAEPSGPNCTTGGKKVSVGPDTNADGALDISEITSSAYICNGMNGVNGGTGLNTVVRTLAEPPGSNCSFGGSRIESGLDANGNGVLDAGEVNAAATSWVCSIGPSGTISPSNGIHVAVTSVSTAAGTPISVRFTLKDDRNFPLDLAGSYSLNAPIKPHFAIGYLLKDATTGIVSPLKMYTKLTSAAVPSGEPTFYNPLGADPGHGSLVENGSGAGDYTYTFPTVSTTNGPVAVAYDLARQSETHVVWIKATRQTDLTYALNGNTFDAAHQPYYYVPDGSGLPVTREIVSQTRCDNCHARFKAETPASAALHGGGRINVGECNVCHNPARISNPSADSASFIHRIHASESIATANLFKTITARYPQDIRACDACHLGAAQGSQAITNPSTVACKGCHDYVSFTAAVGSFCGMGANLLRGVDGKPLPCDHVGGPRTDAQCVSCHGGPSSPFPTASYHESVIPPDPNNIWLVPVGGNSNTNASFVAGAGFVPTGANVISYDVKSVDTVPDTVVPSIMRPRISFKLKNNGADVVFQTYAPPVVELMPNFVGSPSVYFAFAIPQDGNALPADFNATASGYIKKIWDSTATGTSAGIMTGPDVAGYYTITLTGVQIPLTATMLTGGVGYSLSLLSTPPLVQTNLPNYPWTPNFPPDGKAQGGLSVPAANVWKVATGYLGRREIVDNTKCQTCHGALGVAPSFHAGQRNDGQTCSFCHTPNRAIAGWSEGSSYLIHATHARRKRSVPYTWQAAASPAYNEVVFPGTQSGCLSCHFPGTYNFTNSANMAALVRQLPVTVATGIYTPDPLLNSTYLTVSPYIVMDGVTNYGAGFSFNVGSGATIQAAPSTLVLSPITNACVACHDSSVAIGHMKSNGGQFYAPRSTGAAQEQCLMCHGPGRVAAISVVHQR